MLKSYQHIFLHLGLSSLLFMYLLYSQYGTDIPWQELGLPFAGMVVLSVIYSLLAKPIGRLIGKCLAWKTYPGWRLVSGTIVSYLLASILIIVGLSIYRFIDPSTTFASLEEVLLKLFLLLFIIIFIYQLITLGIFAFRHYHQERIRQIEIEQEHLHTQFEILRTQLNPHFLFNCLNTVSALVYSSPKEAEQFVRAFCQTQSANPRYPAGSLGYLARRNDISQIIPFLDAGSLWRGIKIKKLNFQS